MGLLCKVQLTKVIIIDFLSNKWVALTRAGWHVVCVVDYPASSIRRVIFHKVVRRHYSGVVSEFIIFWCEIYSGFCTPKIIKIGWFFAELKGGVFWHTVTTVNSVLPSSFAESWHLWSSTAGVIIRYTTYYGCAFVYLHSCINYANPSIFPFSDLYYRG